MIIDVNPEFGYELVCSIPYAKWLNDRGLLKKVITCTDMKPYYYFCDNVEEIYTRRSIDNNTNGVQNLPNTWIHHNALALTGKDYSELSQEEQYNVNGCLDYTNWTAPDYKSTYHDDTLDLPNNYIIISNRYNLEHGQEPIGYFDIECLYNMFVYLTEAGYSIIYKRPKNTEFATDPNEILNVNITANVEGHGVITDYQLANMFDNVYLLDDIISTIDSSYNTAQLKVYSRASGFISMGGGSSILCSYFKQAVVIYVNTSGDIRPGYFDGDSYFKKLSNADIHPIIDKKDDILKRGYRDYNKLHDTIHNVFKGI
jgi:hypothetical protein